MPTRRVALGAIAASPAWLAGPARAKEMTMTMTMSTRPIPSTKEALPVVGLGTWQTFDVGGGAAEREPLHQVLAAFLDGGGRVIDSSPMYGRAEEVVGDLLAERSDGPRPFLATKV